MSQASIMNLNSALKESRELTEIMSAEDFQEKLKRLLVSLDERTIDQHSELLTLFGKLGFITEDARVYTLSRKGALFYSRVCIDFASIKNMSRAIDGRYILIQPLRIGKNSATYLAEHTILQHKIVLKFIRPGASEDIISALQKIAKIPAIDNLVRPIDVFKTTIKDIFDREASVDCIAFPYIAGPSLREDLNTKDRPLSAYFVVAFIKQLGEVLATLQREGAYHGDLHEDNIIVNMDTSGQLRFNVIDLSYGLTGSTDSKICSDTDLTYFRQHIWRILTVQQGYLSRMSLMKYLGGKVYFAVSAILSQNMISFSDIIGLLEHNPEFNRFVEKKEEFIKMKFGAPTPFKLLRYEEITDPQLATELFAAFPNLMDGIKSFSNGFVSGNRGSGKSTYLASIAFFPRVSQPVANYRESFGVYFPCRQGEFRLLSKSRTYLPEVTTQRVKHLMILKIMRRTLEILSEAIEVKAIKEIVDYDTLKKKLSKWLKSDDIRSMDLSVGSEIKNVLSILILIEMKELEDLFRQDHLWAATMPMTEATLIEFFQTIRHCFVDLASTRFHLLFDDAGEPNIPVEGQQIINDLIFASNSVYCVKLSAERYAYDFRTSDGKQLEEGHDFFEYDISRVLFIGTKGIGLPHSVLQNYFHEIVKKRLRYFNYNSEDIKDYIGDDLVKHEQLINSLASGKRNAMYCGWSMIWTIADRTPRNLLDMVSEIFAAGEVESKSPPFVIENRIQNRVIRMISEKRLRSLAQTSGTMATRTGTIGIGERLYDVARCIGSVFKIYLKAEKGKQRKKQYLAIERNDSGALSKEATLILRKLVRYGVLDESKLEFARDDEMKKSVYVFNRIFSPAFAISMRRDEHLRLSRKRFEELLLDPIEFGKSGTKRLRMHVIDSHIGDLFKEVYDE